MRLPNQFLVNSTLFSVRCFGFSRNQKKCTVGLAYVYACKKHVELLEWQTAKKAKRKMLLGGIGLWSACVKMGIACKCQELVLLSKLEVYGQVAYFIIICQMNFGNFSYVCMDFSP